MDTQQPSVTQHSHKGHLVVIGVLSIALLFALGMLVMQVQTQKTENTNASFTPEIQTSVQSTNAQTAPFPPEDVMNASLHN